jgi:hypothetical protein
MAEDIGEYTAFKDNTAGDDAKMPEIEQYDQHSAVVSNNLSP